jgi:serine/threonine protein phosphatase 1
VLWFSKPRKAEEAVTPAGEAPAGVRVYAIGDVHGRSDLLAELFERVKLDATGYDGVVRVVFLGDLIDRAEDSAGVLELLAVWESWLKGLVPGSGMVVLRGNHEQALIDFIDAPETRPEWLGYGGDMACVSYGVKVRDERAYMRPLTAVAAEVFHELTERDHWRWIEGSLLKWTCGGYLFVHAGVRPQVPLEAQLPHELYIIREPFLSTPHGLPYVVVHGHTPADAPALLPHRMGLDTGAYRSGVLTCAALEGKDVRILQTGSDNAVDKGAANGTNLPA